ncbi:hypothetical protein HDV06_001483 [Boothiomyces sp. JEL0866]|nr:hypothetical protein HDV06_001483 [Boothiomyces sp. JEL0866]
MSEYNDERKIIDYHGKNYYSFEKNELEGLKDNEKTYYKKLKESGIDTTKDLLLIVEGEIKYEETNLDEFSRVFKKKSIQLDLKSFLLFEYINGKVTS